MLVEYADRRREVAASTDAQSAMIESRLRPADWRRRHMVCERLLDRPDDPDRRQAPPNPLARRLG